MGLLDFNRRLFAPLQRNLFLPQQINLFTHAVQKAKDKPPVPQGNPEQEPDGRLDHKIQKNETLSGIAPQYKQTVPDILFTNPYIQDPDAINEGASLRVLSEERRTSLETINSLQTDVDKAASPGEKDEKTKALKLAVNTDLISAAEHGAYTPGTLKTNLDEREADLVALGPQTEAYKTIVQDERKTIETNLNAVFEPLSPAITAAQQ
ncbi:MAG: LysM peptidoglycan-binding domain-containing protein, partial [Phyllobacterium sp.]